MVREWYRLGGFLACMLAATLVLSSAHAQFHSRVLRDELQNATGPDEERWRQLQAIEEARRARAHAGLGSAAGTIDPQAFCPVLVGPTTTNLQPSKRISRPFFARSAPRPTTPSWRGVAPLSESPSTLFTEYISTQVVQAKCVNCHVEGGVSGHTRLVLSPSTVSDHEDLNLSVFENLVQSVEGAPDLILNKIQGVGHGGGIQVPAGSTDFANMERFLRLLGGETTSAGPLSADTLFDGVSMASPGKTLRRAALVFAGRLPTQAELNSVNSGQVSALRLAIRNVMTGEGFHGFLIRASNDRLLTDRHLDGVISTTSREFVELANQSHELAKAAIAKGYEERYRDPAYGHWERALDYGIARAPLELIAHVVENDRPYTEVLTADYIMANPVAAEAYGATTTFDNSNDPLEFKPSEIASYYRTDDSKVDEYDRKLGRRIVNPGNLATDYPHAGVLNTTVFLKRYPSTATNRNRARSRWTYYHFLGLDIEKSAARTTDPDALADTDNPTMKNAACTVCHSVLDPVGGTFQNYGDEGLYRHQYGGLDSLARLYKRSEDGSVSPYRQGDTWYRDMREPGFGGALAPDSNNSLQWLAQQIAADERFEVAAVEFWWPAVLGVEVADIPEDSGDRDFQARLVAATAQHKEVERIASAFRNGIAGGEPYNAKDLLAEIALSPWFRAESLTVEDPARKAALRDAGMGRLLFPEELDRKTEAVSGYVWGRRFRRSMDFGVGTERTALNDFRGSSSYGLLYGGIDSDGIVDRSGDLTPLMASVAQSHAAEVSCPIVRREFFLWSEEKRLLFDGIDKFVTPASDQTEVFDVTADSWETRQTISLAAQLGLGAKTIRLEYPDYFRDDDGNRRELNLDRLMIRNRSGTTVLSLELEDFGTQRCGGREDNFDSFYRMWSSCALEFPVQVLLEDVYTIEVVVHQNRAGDKPAQLIISVESNDRSSRGAIAIGRKLVELHQRLFGVTVEMDSPDVEEAFRLFVEIWDRKRRTEGNNFGDARFECESGDDHHYYEGLIDDVVNYNEWGYSELNWDQVNQFYDGIDMSDPTHAVRAWVVTLAYLMTDPRYLYF